jgi:hypothetical protein
VLGELNSSNAEEVLDVTQYNDFPRDDEQTARRAVLFDALTGAFGHLSDGSLPGPRILADDLGPDVKRGDLLFWSLHPQDQPLLDRLGLGGAFPSAEGKDLFAVVDQNVANNKIDAYLQRTITDQVRYDRSDGRVESTVQVVLQNQAPAGGLPEEVLGSYMNSGLPIGTNYSWLTLYSPLDLTSATVDGKPLTMAGTPELGVTAYSGYVKVAPKSTLTVTAHLSGRIDRGPYAITVFQQPTVLQDRTTVSVGAVDWRLPADRVVRKTFG